MRKQRLAIEYWNQRVEQRKAYWNQQMREAFDRNMSVIDQAVNYSRDELNRNPHDEVSEEMLNSALNDKMELLREFADL
jgi:aryl-alcohol dehydrogenase-like predicted oxidoreductase